MGQKVHPIGFRQGIESKRENFQKNPITQERNDIFDRKAFFNFGPSLNLTKNNQGNSLQQKFRIQSLVEEIFTKSGQQISHFFIEESTDSLTIKIDVFNRQRTSPPTNFQDLPSFHNFLGAQEGSTLKNQIQSIQNPNEENKVQGTSLRRRTWTKRRLPWRQLTQKDLLFFSKLIEKTMTAGLPVKWKIRLLNKNLNPNQPLIQNLFRSLGPAKNQDFFQDGISILSLVLNEPHAPLLAQQIAQELSLLRRHSNFIQYIKEGLSQGLEFQRQEKIRSSNLSPRPSPKTNEFNINLRGFLIQIKGRINGSDRQRLLRARQGSVPLHTINAPLDYGFSEAVTIQGKCSVKLWLKQA